MKINILIKINRCILLTLYIVLVLLTKLYSVWFSLALIFISIPTLIKSAYYNLDSKLWFGVFFMLSGIVGIYMKSINIDIQNYYYMYILMIGVSSLLVFSFFRQNIHLKVFVFSFFEVLLLVIQRLKLLTSFEFGLVQGVIILYIIIDLTKRAEINFGSN